MATNPFNKLRQQESPNSSFRWYQQAIRRLGLSNLTPQRVLRSDIGEFVSTVLIGNMYLFKYDPKFSEKLPYYDMLPLVMPFRKVNDGFIGINFHYLPYMQRMRLLEKIVSIQSKKLTDTTRLQLTWAVLDNASRFPGIHSCVKRYLYTHIMSRVMKINPMDWRKTIMLPVEDFQKASNQEVFNNSVQQQEKDI